MESFSERLNILLKERGITPYKIAKDIGVNKQTIMNYIDGLNIPSIDKALLIADYFSVSLDWLIAGRENSSKVNNDDKNKYIELLEENRMLRIKIDKLEEKNKGTKIYPTGDSIHISKVAEPDL